MKLDFYRLTPPGTDLSKYRSKFRLVLSVCILFSQGYWIEYLQCRSLLFEKGKLVPGRYMPSFWEIFSVNGSYPFIIPYFVAIFMMFYWMLRFYFSFSLDSKSIYLMKRLPDRWELLRRCVTVPLLCIAVLIALLVLTVALFYGGYYLFTPKSAIM